MADVKKVITKEEYHEQCAKSIPAGESGEEE